MNIQFRELEDLDNDDEGAERERERSSELVFLVSPPFSFLFCLLFLEVTFCYASAGSLLEGELEDRKLVGIWLEQLANWTFCFLTVAGSLLEIYAVL